VATVARPTGLIIEADGNLLVTTDQLARVNRFDGEGNFIERVINGANSGVVGAIFLTVLNDAATVIGIPVDSAGQQAWLIGVGEMGSDSLLAEMLITDGTAFGNELDPGMVRRLPWGITRLTVISCDRAQFGYESIDERYGSGRYEMIRVAPNQAQRDCEVSGLSPHILNGTWFCAERSGEGIMVEVFDNGQGVLSWYTYRLVESG